MRRVLGLLTGIGLMALAPVHAAGQEADTTPPTITFQSPVDRQPVVMGSQLVLNWTCEDEPGGSGVADCSGSEPYGTQANTRFAGAHTLTVGARDAAGNVAERTITWYAVPTLQCFGEDVTVFMVRGDHPTNGDDVILGRLQTADDDGGDTINARGGDDLVCAHQGPDTVRGGPGNDSLWADSGLDVVFGGPGRDEIHGGVEADLLDGGLGNDLIYGESGADKLLGGDGRDWLSGGRNLDRCWGGDGQDAVTSCEVRRGLP
jgi:Ca2+-binding RTX toxin-like protein